MGHSIKNHFFSIDWISFTFTFRSAANVGIDVTEYTGKPFDLFLDIFPEFRNFLNNFALLEYGRFGYSTVYALSDEMMIMTNDDKEELGVFVTVPSHGLYKLGEIFNLPKVTEDYYACQKLFQTLLQRGARFSRLDFCYDDFNKRLRPFDFNDFMSQGYIKSHARMWSYINGTSRDSGTFYLGRRGKNKFLRIYNKSAESNGEIDSIRYEMECKSDFAQDLAFNIASGIKFTFLHILDNFIDVLDVEDLSEDKIKELNSTNRGRQELFRKRRAAERFEKWQQLREDIENSSQNAECTEVYITSKKSITNLQRKLDWFDSIAKSLLVIRKVVGYDIFNNYFEKARDKLTDFDKNYIKNYNNLLNDIINDDFRQIEF